MKWLYDGVSHEAAECRGNGGVQLPHRWRSAASTACSIIIIIRVRDCTVTFHLR